MGQFLNVTAFARTLLAAASAAAARSLLGLTRAEVDYVLLCDSKASGTNGGSCSAATTATRTINTEITDTGGVCTLASNQFTLLAGTYRISASVPAYNCDRTRAKLYNVTDAADVSTVIGTSEAPLTTTQTRCCVFGEFTIASGKAFEIRHYTQSAVASTGFGVAVSSGANEIYTVVELWRKAG